MRAVSAFCFIGNNSAVFKGKDSALAFINASEAIAASVPRLYKQLRSKALAFGITAPRTAKRTALEEDGGAYSVTVKKAEALNIKDICGNFVYHFAPPDS